ncbi:aldo/keto reductase [Nocardioides lentus]|uniref:Aldo/keto reductase n=1 Tax=Nocardioides lentus TaxID=338077 RepID=A0ABP5ADD1_9ACTN
MSAVIGLGTAALGRPEYITLHREVAADLGVDRYDRDRLEAHAHAVLDAAWDAGVRHLDTARSYGSGEAFVGSWLAAHPGRRAELRVGSKWGYTYVADFTPGAEEHEVKDHGVDTFERQWAETQQTLGQPDLYLVHSLTTDSPALADGVLLDRLRDLAAIGVRVGLSTSGADQSVALRRALALSDSPFSTVQATWNVLETSVGGLLAEAHDAGWLVVVKEAMANGRLAGPDSPLAGAAAEAGVGPDALALAAVRRQPFVDVVLSGASSVAQLHANLAASSYDGPVPDVVAEDPGSYWATRSALAWS